MSKLTVFLSSVPLVALAFVGSFAEPLADAAGVCPGNPLKGVHDPGRLKVLKECQVYKGVVKRVKHEPDGDYHVVVKPDPGYGHFLNSRDPKDGLVTEIIPSHPLTVPRVGQHIREVGTWVLDRGPGWREIHPIWKITKL